MDIEILEINGSKVVLIKSEKILIHETRDALDLIANGMSLDCGKIILNEKHFVPDFFDLRTGIAGEILQKFTNYNMQLAIVGDFSKYESKNLNDFIFESNKYGRINFVGSVEEAKEKLAKNSFI